MINLILLTTRVLMLLFLPLNNEACINGPQIEAGTVASKIKNPGVQDESYLKCDLNGKTWTATKMVPDKYASEIVQIQGTNDKTALWLQLNKPAPGKTDALFETDLNYWSDEKFNMYRIKSGKTVITKMNDKWIEGTFSFIAIDDRSRKKIEAINGSFKVPNPRSLDK